MRLIDADQLATCFSEKRECARSLSVGNTVVVEYLSAISKEILSSKLCREYPDVITFGYFCRKSSIKRTLADRGDLSNCFGWGDAIHIAPSNVPVNFAFSFVFGLLSGNSNLVRLPSSIWPQVDVLIHVFEKIASLEEYSELRKRNAFIRTERNNSKLNAAISACDALIVWGGDDTVSTFRTLPKKPRCVELYFPDRISSLVLNSNQICELGESDLLKLARSFFNDTFLVDNNACSSPRKIFWVGEKYSIEDAKKKFWDSVKAVLTDSKYELNIVAKIDKYLDVLSAVSQSKKALPITKVSEDIWLDQQIDAIILGRFGRFNQASFQALVEVMEWLGDDEQTLTYYGFNLLDLRQAILMSGALVDRVVPIGSALDIGFYWDGVDVIQRLSRKVLFS